MTDERPTVLGVSDRVLSADEIRATYERVRADLSPTGLDFGTDDYVDVGGHPKDGDTFEDAGALKWYRWHGGEWVRAPDLDERYGGGR